MKTAISQGRRIHFLPPYRFRNMLLHRRVVGYPACFGEKLCFAELIKAVVDLRSVKEPCEIEEITKACNIGYRNAYSCYAEL